MCFHVCLCQWVCMCVLLFVWLSTACVFMCWFICALLVLFIFFRVIGWVHDLCVYASVKGGDMIVRVFSLSLCFSIPQFLLSRARFFIIIF